MKNLMKPKDSKTSLVQEESVKSLISDDPKPSVLPDSRDDIDGSGFITIPYQL